MDIKHDDDTYTDKTYIQRQLNLGWICPNCGRGLAPFVSECPCHYTMNGYTWSNDTMVDDGK
jgi:hypothetical protein